MKSVVKFLLCAFFSLAAVAPVYAQLTLNVIAVNPSEKKEKEIDFKFHLPKELEPDNILDTGELELDYDVRKGLYYVKGKAVFQPRETKTFKIRVEDVWRVTEDEIAFLKQQLNENLRLLENDEVYPLAVTARDQLVEEMDFILSQQTNYSDNINRRIEQYRAYAARLDEIRDNSYSFDFLKRESKAINEMAEIDKTVRFVVEVRNPSDKDQQEVELKHYLPKEIREENVVDSLDFDVRYDENKELAYFTKEETFNPGESRKYEFVIEDVWNFPISRLEAIKTSAEEIFEEIRGSEFEESAQFLLDAIIERLEDVRESQEADLPIEQHIGRFRINQKRYEEALKDLERLDQMLSVVRQKKLEELEGSKVKNVLSRLKALRGLSALSEALFKRGISVTVTWRIIFGMIIFVAFFSALHFFIWSKRSGRMGEELAAKDGGITEVPKPGTEPDEEE